MAAQLDRTGSSDPCDLAIHDVTRQNLQCGLCHLWAICLGLTPMMFAYIMLEPRRCAIKKRLQAAAGIP